MRTRSWLSLLVVACGIASADDETTPVFRSQVAMGRLDTLVLDQSQRPVRGLHKQDFVLRQDGQAIPIRDLAQEDLPVDVLLLLDVSGSMRVHVQVVADAAHDALAVLGPQDRVGIMVFDTHTRLRLAFRQDLRAVERRLDDTVRSERFLGGTNINGALLDAAAYVEREGRRQARHAVVIVTDDQATPCDQNRVLAALDRADAVLMVLLAPPFIPRTSGGGPITRPGPPLGGPLGGPLGPIILGRRRASQSPPVTIGYPGSGVSAGSPEIARSSGGDSLKVHDASSVENTFERIRQRYAIYFYLPEGFDAARGLELDLADTARRRHPDAALQYRQVTLAADGARPGLITRVSAHPPSAVRAPEPQPEPEPEPAVTDSTQPRPRRRGVSDSIGPQVSIPARPPESPPAESKIPSRRGPVSEPDHGPRAVIIPSP